MKFKIGDEVEGLNVDAQAWINKYGNRVVGVSIGSRYLRFAGRPNCGYNFERFKLATPITLENE